MSEITPQEGHRYLIGIAWWPDDVVATFIDGAFVPDGYENVPERRYPPHMVSVWEEVA